LNIFENQHQIKGLIFRTLKKRYSELKK
jgi:hypothetical protein